jgi:lactoylglutathione lyase
MKFCWCTIMVSDLEASIRFYRDVVGLTVNRRFPAGSGNEIAFMGDGETQIELFYNPGKPQSQFGSDLSLGFVVDSLDVTMNSLLKQGIPVDSGPFQPNPGIRFFYVRDPDGLKIQFVENCPVG